MTALLQDDHVSTVQLEGELRAPVGAALTQTVEEMIVRGERRVLLDLARVEEIDAAGIGELIAAFNVMREAGGVLQVAHARARVRRVLDVAGVLNVLGLPPGTARQQVAAAR
jgi:anti-anti-sigma factor